MLRFSFLSCSLTSHFLFLTNMPVNFTKRHEAEKRAQGVAFRQASLTPARVVDRASISATAGTSSKDTTSPSTTPQVPASLTTSLLRQLDRSKGKEPVVAPSKRARDGNKSKPVRKRTSQGIKLTDSAELREVAPVTAQVLALLPL